MRPKSPKHPRPPHDGRSSTTTLTPAHGTPAGEDLDRAHISISDIANETGISSFSLRIWEHRYHWPEPTRQKNGYRLYTTRHLLALKAVRKLLDSGKSIGEILMDDQLGIRDGKIPNLRPTSHRPIERRALDFSHIPQPDSAEAKRLRAGMEEALCARDLREVERLRMLGDRLHPRDRQNAIVALIRHADDPTAPS